MSNKTGLAMDVVTATEIWKRAKQGKVQGFETMTLEDAKIVLADACLAQLREDDGELVPEGIQDIEGGYITVFRDEYNLWVIPAWHTDGRIKWRVFLPNQPTMGQLRHLIRGLGGEA